MAQAPKVVPERVRRPLAGPPRNAGLQAALLERARAELVKRYRESSAPWPDGIDTKYDRWYGDGSGWTQERIERALSEEVFEGKSSVAVALSSSKPWEAEGVSRRTWYRRHRERSDVKKSDAE